MLSADTLPCVPMIRSLRSLHKIIVLKPLSRYCVVTLRMAWLGWPVPPLIRGRCACFLQAEWVLTKAKDDPSIPVCGFYEGFEKSVLLLLAWSGSVGCC